MQSALTAPAARFWRWWLFHNPSYLLSAVCMAVGARLLLVSPHTRAGDVGSVLLTLGVLQLYEWAVAGILVLLHRSGRSPEDKVMLLLVGGLFWTGPLAATAEMTARNPRLGVICAVAAAVIAAIELGTVRRLVGLLISAWTHLMAGACLVLLAIAPALLHVPENVDGRNEIFLYVAWWVLGTAPLLLIGSIRGSAGNASRPRQSGAASPRLRFDLAFAAIVLATTVAQFAAMNYAFFGHARFFYAGPLIISITVIGWEVLAQFRGAHRFILWTIASLPAVAALLACQDFDVSVPIQRLPSLFRNPQTPLLLAASVAWWIGALRHRRAGLMHLANAALLLAIWQMTSATVPVRHVMTRNADVARDLLTSLMYAATGYLAVSAWLRRSRSEAFAAILLHQVALTLLVWDRHSADLFIVLISIGWHTIISLFVIAGRPSWRLTLVPVAFLMLITWFFDFGSELWWARAHAMGMVTLLTVAGLMWPWTRFRRIGLSIAPCHLTFYTGHWLSTTTRPIEGICIVGAFLLLASGAALSWNKQRLLPEAPDENEPDDEGEIIALTTDS